MQWFCVIHMRLFGCSFGIFSNSDSACEKSRMSWWGMFVVFLI